jgi:hypothetical protein
MGPGVRRVVFGLLVVLAILVMNRRITDDPRQMGNDRVPPLWSEAVHSDWPDARSSEGKLVTVVNTADPPVNCPIVVSLDLQNPYRLTSIEDGVQFDIDADGDLDQVSWTEAGSDVAFLARDRNDDGRITDGRELISDHTIPGAKNGFTALLALATAEINGERRAMLDGRNPLFSRMMLWADANHNGVSEEAELQSASQLISTIGLGYGRHHRRDQHGNESRHVGYVHVRTAPGLNRSTIPGYDVSRSRPLYDVCLVSRE